MHTPRIMAYRFIGQLEINGHCHFDCEELEGSVHRRVRIRAEHCGPCIAELRRIAARCAFRLNDEREQRPVLPAAALAR